jgi:hypothetical protein
MLQAMRPNLANPTREPTDEELGELMREAFAEGRLARQQVLAELHERIRRERVRLRALRLERKRAR